MSIDSKKDKVEHVIDLTRDEIRCLREEFQMKFDWLNKQNESLRTLLINCLMDI